jgi:glutamine amidotransferase
MKSPQVTIVDYGMGNLLSVSRALEKVGASVNITSNSKDVTDANYLVLPGVGAFPNAMQAIRELGLERALQEVFHRQIPTLAVCLGMQLLMEESDEFGETMGLGIIEGKVIKIPRFGQDGKKLKSPHIGWSSLEYPSGRESWKDTVLSSNLPKEEVYFVHSYMVKPLLPQNIIATTTISGIVLPAVIENGSVTGCQFHPEKSGEIGLKILRNFICR